MVTVNITYAHRVDSTTGTVDICTGLLVDALMQETCRCATQQSMDIASLVLEI